MRTKGLDRIVLGALFGAATATVAISLVAPRLVPPRADTGIRPAASDAVWLAVLAVGADERAAKPPESAIAIQNGSWALDLERPLPRQIVELSDELVEMCLEVAADLDDELAERLGDLRERDPKTFEQRLRRSRRLLALAETKLRQPALYDLKRYELTQDAKILRMARELRRMRAAGEGPTADRLEDELRIELYLQLALSHRTRRDYLDCLRDFIQKAEQEIDAEAARANEIVEERLRDLIGSGPAAVPASPVG